MVGGDDVPIDSGSSEMRELWWAKHVVKVVHIYRDFEHRHARLQQALAKVGLGAFLSGHDGWYFHGGVVRPENDRD